MHFAEGGVHLHQEQLRNTIGVVLLIVFYPVCVGLLWISWISK